RSPRRGALTPQPSPRAVPAPADAAAQIQMFGSTFEFADDWAELGNDKPVTGNAGPETGAAGVPPPAATGRALAPAKLELDPQAIAALADYGEPPENAARTLGYAYRVFVRRRALLRELGPIAAACERAQNELGELVRALLAERGENALPEAWRERLRAVSERADRLLVRREMQRRALAAYDEQAARHGVRLACTGAALILVLFAFKLFF
ncbi:MAG TPA: hypothetical protein VFK05_14225, partial [Polyangiaceae bacterium]|nr:hypothetical protein [Polyangiaceae bacterium]